MKTGGKQYKVATGDKINGEKLIVFKFKKRKNYKRTRGHRQNLTRVEINAIEA